MDTPESRSLEMDTPESRSLEMDTPESRSLEMDTLKSRSLEMDTPESRSISLDIVGTGNSNPDVLSAEEVYLVEFEMFTPNMQQLEEEADMAYKQFGYQLEQFKQGKKIKTSQLWYF